MEWCPQHALNAYLKTLHLRKNYGIEASRTPDKSSRFDEPKIMEFLSALAAGNRAKYIVQITSEGVTSITLALAVAAKQTGGKFLCLVPTYHDGNHDKENINRSNHIYDLINGYGGDDHDHLKDVAKFVVGGNPCEIIKQHKEIDFLVIDSKFGDHLNLLKNASVNPKGSVVVITNVLNPGRKKESVGEIVKKKYGVECVSEHLPMAEGIELTKILPSCKKFDRSKKCRRFHVTYEY